MSRVVDIKYPRKALLLICEGRNTEPIFFANFRSFGAGLTFDISPKPRVSKIDLKTNSNRGGHRRVSRQLQGSAIVEDDIVITGTPPMSWIEAAEKQFDTYEEIWCIFDKDEHPASKEAFDKAQSIVEAGHNLHIAFSSIAIEYYFLLHFEYLYKAFSRSECKVSRKKKANCLLANASEEYACSGDKCVNGYARLKKYWVDSKSDENCIFPLIKDKLFIGIKNAALLRRQSRREEGDDKPIYERNPYTTVDYLVSRLLGYVVLDTQTYDMKIGATTASIQRNGDAIEITNCGDASVILNQDFLSSHSKEVVLDSMSKMLEPNKSITLDLPGPEGTIFFITGTREKALLVK